jgi:hypothetical protein
VTRVQWKILSFKEADYGCGVTKRKGDLEFSTTQN